ncbi:MAG: TlyA family RNA methyltransferase [Acidimicrobiia bacterium]
MRRRLDRELVRRGVLPSRAEAQRAIGQGRVRVAGMATPKASTLVDPGAGIHLVGDGPHYVSRGGVKLAGALDAFGLAVAGRRALDCGASTGGFTDCLLQRGAASVSALDVGYGQLDQWLRDHPGVEVRERINLREATPELLGGRFDLVVADLSFISLCTVAGSLAGLAAPGADLVVLVKPQFEVGRRSVGKGGVVRDPGLWEAAVKKVRGCFEEAGLEVQGVVASALPGAKGNREFFLWARGTTSGAAPSSSGSPSGAAPSSSGSPSGAAPWGRAGR